MGGVGAGEDAGPRLLIIDEDGYLPLAAEVAAALSQVIAQRYLRGSVILTTNLGIASWGRIFDDPTVAAAMLDRLLHRSVVFAINGDSYRMRVHQARAEHLRKAVMVPSNRSADVCPTRVLTWGVSVIADSCEERVVRTRYLALIGIAALAGACATPAPSPAPSIVPPSGAAQPTVMVTVEVVLPAYANVSDIVVGRVGSGQPAV